MSTRIMRVCGLRIPGERSFRAGERLGRPTQLEKRPALEIMGTNIIDAMRQRPVYIGERGGIILTAGMKGGAFKESRAELSLADVDDRAEISEGTCRIALEALQLGALEQHGARIPGIQFHDPADIGDGPIDIVQPGIAQP